MRRGIFLATLLVFSTVVSAAGVYKWVDEQGRVHYGERPPAQTKAQQMEIKDRPLGSQTGSEDDRRDKEQRLLRAYEEEREQHKAEKAKSDEAEAERERNCHVARDRARRFETATYVYDLDSKGDRRVLSDAERAIQEQRAREEVNKWCN